MIEKIKINEEVELIVTDIEPSSKEILKNSTSIIYIFDDGKKSHCYLRECYNSNYNIPDRDSTFQEVAHIILEIYQASKRLSPYYKETLIRFIGNSRLCNDFYKDPLKRNSLTIIPWEKLEKNYDQYSPRVYGPSDSFCIFEFLEYLRANDALVCIDPELVGEYKIVSGYKRQNNINLSGWCKIENIVGNQSYPNLSLRLITDEGNVFTYTVVLEGLLHSRFICIMLKDMASNESIVEELKRMDCIISEMSWKNSYFLDLNSMPIINEHLIENNKLCKEVCNNFLAYRDCVSVIRYLNKKGIRERQNDSIINIETKPIEVDKIEKRQISCSKFKMEVSYYPKLTELINNYIKKGDSGLEYLNKLFSSVEVNQDELDKYTKLKIELLRKIRYSNFKYIMSGQVVTQPTWINGVGIFMHIN